MKERLLATDGERSRAAAQRVVADVATGVHGALAFIGDRLGIFKAMKDAGPLTVEELARRTGLVPRYLREWLCAMAAGEYLAYDPATESFTLEEHFAAALADEESPYFAAGYFQMLQALTATAPRVAQAFQEGGGVPQSEFPPWTFEATSRNSYPRYRHKLVQNWIDAMPEVVAKLRAGATVADVGCGRGRAAIAVAQAFPAVRVFGFDVHGESVERARRRAEELGIGGRVTFENANATSLPAGRFDLVMAMDVVHDAVDPVALAASIRAALARGGTFLMQEINVGPRLEDNIRTLGKMAYSVSTLYCMTVSLAGGGAGIGAAMGEVRAREIAGRAGFTHFRRLPVEDDFAVLYELKA